MKNIFRFFSLVAFVACAAISCNKELVEQPLLELDRSHMKMTKGQSQKLNATVKGVEAECVWESADADVATVDEEGKVTAISAGSTKVAVSAAGMKKECEIVVVDFTAAKLELNKEFAQDKQDASKYTHMIMKDDQLQINPRFYNSDGERVDDLAYPRYNVVQSIPSKSGTDVLSVSEDGFVEGLNPGVATVRVSGAGREAEVVITVKAIELSDAILSLFVNQSEFLAVDVLPESLSESEKKVEWSSSSPEHVKVNSGQVTGLVPTSEPVVVKARCGDLIAECKVTVTDYEIDQILLTGLESLKVGDEYQMLVGDNPHNLNVRFAKGGEDVTEVVKSLKVDVVYNSSNKDVADVENGIISVKMAGSTEIKVSCAGKSTSFILNVIQRVESVKIIAPTSNPYIINRDVKTFTVEYEVYPENSYNKTATFSSTAPDVASVDEKSGVVTVHKPGDAEIVVTTDGFKRPYVGSDGATVVEQASVNLILVVSDETTTLESLAIAGDGVHEGALTITKGNKLQLMPVVTPSSYVGTYNWMTSTPNVVSVDQTGMLTALAPGEGKIVLVTNGTTAELIVNVVGINPTAIKINEEGGNYPATIGSLPLTASMTAPENGDFAGVNWYSSDEKVATVDDKGIVTVHKHGEVTITAKAKSQDGKELSTVYSSVVFFFEAPELKEVSIVSPKTKVEIGETVQLVALANPKEAVIPNQIWTIVDDDNDFASITSEGAFTGVRAELETDDTGQDSDWKYVTVQLSVNLGGENSRTLIAESRIQIIPKQPTGIELDLPQNSQLKINESWDFNPRVLPADLTGFTVGVYSTPYGSMTNANAPFIPETPGSYQLTFYTESNDNLVYQRQRSVSISVDPYWVESVSIPATYELEQGGSAILVPEFTSDTPGKEPYDKTVKWTSMDESVVKVDANGKITAVAPGTAEVKITTNGSWSVPGGEQHKTASCMVTVKAVATVINVGDYYYSDGTTSPQLVAGKTVVGIVISRDNASSTDVKLPKDCTHGLVLALGQGEGNWSSSYDAGKVNTWALANGYQNTTGVYYSAGAYVTNDFGKRLLGHNNTSALRGYLAKYGYTSGIVTALDTYAATVSLPASASEMYIPSIAEMQMIHNNLDVINAALEAAGGTTFIRDSYDTQKDLYWTTSENESSSGNAAAVNPFSGELHGGVLKGSGIKKVRFIFAF